MNLKQRIDADLKSAMLGGDKTLVTTLRTLKSVILYAELASGEREQGLSDKDIITLLRKESKKRQESAELFAQGGNQTKADDELQELKVIEAYLPAQLSDEALTGLVDQAFSDVNDNSPQAMGKLIARVKELSGGAVDGGRIAMAVKQRLAK
jgi:uncharacterized protein YqeY